MILFGGCRKWGVAMTGWMVGDDIEGCVRMRQQQMVTTMARQQMVTLTVINNAMRRGRAMRVMFCV